MIARLGLIEMDEDCFTCGSAAEIGLEADASSSANAPSTHLH